MTIRPSRHSRKRASALLLVLFTCIGIAALITVGAFIARQQTQTVRARSGSGSARLAIESTANLILGYLDMQSRTNTGIYAGAFQTWINQQGLQQSANYFVNPTNDINLASLNFDFSQLYAFPLNQTYDPDWTAARMQTTNLVVTITAHSTKGDPDQIGTYTFTLRALPLSEFAVFSHNILKGTVIVDENEAGRNKALVFSADNTADLNTPSGLTLLQLTTQTGSGKYRRAAGKQENPWSEIKRTLNLNDTDLVNWDTLGTTGTNAAYSLNASAQPYLSRQLAFRSQGINVDIDGSFARPHPTGFNTFTPTGIAATGAGVPGFSTFTFTQPFTYFGYQQTNLVVVNLAAVVGGGSASIIFPAISNAVYIVTNATTLPVGSTVKLTFPPTTTAFFRGSVNTNGSARLRVEGNIGMISQALNLFDPTATSALQVRKTVPDTFRPGHTVADEVTAVTNISRALIPLDAVAVPPAFATDPALTTALLQWAQAQQSTMLADNSSPYYLPNGDKYFLPIKPYPLTSSTTASLGTSEDDNYARYTTMITNNVVNYNFAGWFTLATCDSQTMESVILNNYEPPGAIPQLGIPYNLNNTLGAFVTRTIITLLNPKAYLNPLIIPIAANTPNTVLSTNFWSHAVLNTWSPINSTWGDTIPDNNNPAILQGYTYYAETWITIEPGTYDEHYTEYRTNFVEAPYVTVNTVSDQTVNVPASDRDINSVTWRSQLFGLWHDGITNYITPGQNPLFNPNAYQDRFNGATDTGIGGWKHSYITTETRNYLQTTTIATEAATLNKPETAPLLTRTVRFHYRPIGWTINVAATQTNAPPIPLSVGRWVANQRVTTLAADNLNTVNIRGQLTIKNRPDPSGRLVDVNYQQYSEMDVTRDPSVFPSEPDRIYDVRLVTSQITPKP